MKAIWRAVSHGVRTALVHHYDGNTCTGAEHVVSHLVRVTGPDSHFGRLVRLHYTPEEARELAAELLTAAANAAHQNLESS